MSLFKLIISRNKENDVLEKSEQELLSDNIVDYCVSYFAGDLTESMIQELCIDLVKYCHLTKYPNGTYRKKLS